MSPIVLGLGGGNTNLGLNNITLRWMARKALFAGVPVDPAKIPADAAIDAGTDIKEPLDPVALGRRKLRPADRVHYTVSDRQGERYNNPPASHPRETAADEQQTGG